MHDVHELLTSAIEFVRFVRLSDSLCAIGGAIDSMTASQVAQKYMLDAFSLNQYERDPVDSDELGLSWEQVRVSKSHWPTAGRVREGPHSGIHAAERLQQMVSAGGGSAADETA